MSSLHVQGPGLGTEDKKQEDRSVCFAELKLRTDSVTPLAPSSRGLSSIGSGGPTDRNMAPGTHGIV